MKKVVDLFSGCGGFSTGFHLADFEIICAIDHWGIARKTISMNHGKAIIPKDAKKYNFDVEKISKLPDDEFHKIIPDSEIIIGSPPCVSFSNSNRSGYTNKDLGIRLIESFMRIVARKKYKNNSILEFWIMENVSKVEKFVKDKYIFNPCNDAQKYENQKNIIEIEILNKNNYKLQDYGVPSNRKRFFCGDYIEPQKDENFNDKKYHLGNILNALSNKEKNTKISDPNWQKLNLNSNKITDHHYIDHIPEWCWVKAKRQKRDKGYMGQMSFPENLDKVSRTVMAFNSNSARESFILPYRKNQFRGPTIRELATLMSFPISYQFHGSSHASKRKQVGNAVPPKFSFKLAQAINGIKNPNLKKLKESAKIDKDFIDLKTLEFPKPVEKKKTFEVIFDHHIPFLKINTYRTVLDNRMSDWKNRQIKWKVSIHKGQGDYKEIEPPINFCKNILPNITKNELKIIEKLKKMKGTSFSLHNGYRETLDRRREEKILGPIELLLDVKNSLIAPRYKNVQNFSEIEMHIDVKYREYKFFDTKQKIEVSLPEPVFLGYYFLKLIMK